MQSHEGVRLEPVSADAVPAVDQGHADLGMVDQCVGERHPHGPRTYHEVVGFDPGRHGSTVALPPRLVHESVGGHATLTAAEILRPPDRPTTSRGSPLTWRHSAGPTWIASPLSYVKRRGS